MSKITVQHYLNFKAKSSQDFAKKYPVYVRIIFRRKSIEIKSRLIKEKYSVKAFENHSKMDSPLGSQMKRETKEISSFIFKNYIEIKQEFDSGSFKRSFDLSEYVLSLNPRLKLNIELKEKIKTSSLKPIAELFNMVDFGEFETVHIKKGFSDFIKSFPQGNKELRNYINSLEVSQNKD